MNTYSFRNSKTDEVFTTEANTYSEALESLIQHIGSRDESDLANWIYSGE